MDAELQAGPGRKIRQARSRRTYRAFIDAGFQLLGTEEFESLTIARIAEHASYSVGAFYSRFESKDEFFEALVAHHLAERSAARAKLLATASRETLISAMIDGLVRYYWRRRRFWRAVLMRSTNDPEFWAPINESAQEFVGRLTMRIQSDAGRELSQHEVSNIRFAIHTILGVVNNRIVNRPNPSLNGRPAFVRNLTRAFVLISDYDSLKTVS